MAKAIFYLCTETVDNFVHSLREGILNFLSDNHFYVEAYFLDFKNNNKNKRML